MSDTAPALTFGADELQSVESFRRRTDTAVLTIMFTDIEGFTELTDRKGEAHANRVRHLHDEVLDAVITRDGAGIVVKRIGDAVMAVFAEPSTAVARALEIQEALDRFDTEHPELEPLRVRVGLDMGQVTVEEQVDADVFGRHVNRASRIEGLASGGQVFMSYTVFDSARGWLSGMSHRFEWASHGRFRLKGVSDPAEVFEVVDPDRRTLTPPRDGQRVRAVPGLAWAAGFVLLGIVGTVAWTQWEATEVLLSDIDVQDPWLDFSTPLELGGTPEDERRPVLNEVGRGAHVVHYDVADAVRYYAAFEVERGENLVRPAWEESRIPTLSRRTEAGDDPVTARREGTFFVFDDRNRRIERTAVVELSLEAAPVAPDTLGAEMTWRLTLDGEVVAEGSRRPRNPISTRQDHRDAFELYADEHVRFQAEIRLIRTFAEFDVLAAFQRPER